MDNEVDIIGIDSDHSSEDGSLPSLSSPKEQVS